MLNLCFMKILSIKSRIDKFLYLKTCINSKNLVLTTLLSLGISISAYSQTISGTSDPCSNENISYSFTQAGGFCADVPCTPTTGAVKHSFVINDGWTADPAGAAEIASPTSLTTNIKWNCNSGKSVNLKFTAKCHTFTPVTVTVDGVTTTTCVEATTEQPTTKSIVIKCPIPLIIKGPTYITCCDISQKNYYVENTFGQEVLWSVENGWAIVGSKTGSSIQAIAGSSGASQDVTITAGNIGCNFETKAVSTIHVSRTPIIVEDIAPSLPWITQVCHDFDRDFCVKPITTCGKPTTYSWTVAVGNTQSGSPPVINSTLINVNCFRVNATASYKENNGYVDITVTATTPCGSTSKTHRILLPYEEPPKPTWTWDGATGPLCATSRNVIFELTNQEEGGEYEWTFDNGTTSYALEGYQVGTYFDEFGPTWASNPNSNVSLTIRAKNVCGYSLLNTTFLISAARFKAPNNPDCGGYTRKRSEPNFVNNRLICYPSPANKLITIMKPSNVKHGELKIYNTIGKLESKYALDSDISINTENWASGIYYLYLTGNSQTFSTKIEIKK